MVCKTRLFTKKTAVVILIFLAVVLISIVLIVGFTDRSLKAGVGNITDNEARLDYMSGLGWECEELPVEEIIISLPEKFDTTLSSYNELQLSQGFDLFPYAGLEVELYRYKITNYPSCENAEATIFVYRGRVIGGDVHSPSINGFMHGLF